MSLIMISKEPPVKQSTHNFSHNAGLISRASAITERQNEAFVEALVGKLAGGEHVDSAAMLAAITEAMRETGRWLSADNPFLQQLVRAFTRPNDRFADLVIGNLGLVDAARPQDARETDEFPALSVETDEPEIATVTLSGLPAEVREGSLPDIDLADVEYDSIEDALSDVPEAVEQAVEAGEVEFPSEPELVEDQVEIAPDFDSMTVAQLKVYAADSGIDLGGATKKAEIIAVLKSA